MDPWNCCCNINCLAKMHYTFIFNHWRVSKLSGEKEHCKQCAKQGDDGAGRCNFKRQMMGCQQAQMRECELVRCQLMHGHTFLLAAWAPTPQAFKKDRIGARPFKPPSNQNPFNAEWLCFLVRSKHLMYTSVVVVVFNITLCLDTVYHCGENEDDHTTRPSWDPVYPTYPRREAESSLAVWWLQTMTPFGCQLCIASLRYPTCTQQTAQLAIMLWLLL